MTFLRAGVQPAVRNYVTSYVGAFAKLRKASVSFVMYFRPHSTTLLPLDGFT